MPILEPDPWRQHFFDQHPCPERLFIPTKDPDAYCLNPEHHWAYNKLLIAEKQGIACGPHGVTPTRFPVFSKPIYNLRSMGPGCGVVASPEAYERALSPG